MEELKGFHSSSFFMALLATAKSVRNNKIWEMEEEADEIIEQPWWNTESVRIELHTIDGMESLMKSSPC